MPTRDYTAGAKLIELPSGRFEIEIKGRIVPSPRGEGWTLFQAECVIDRIEQRCREVAPAVMQALADAVRWN